MVSINRTGLHGWEDEIADQWRREFAERQCIVMPSLIEESLLEHIVHRIETAFFFENSHIGENHEIFATDQTIDHKNLALHQVHLLLNNQTLFKLVEYITGCAAIGSFSGRIYRNMPGSGHQLDWHDDTTGKTRLIALSMNLGRQQYEGGIFQIRKKGTEDMLKEVNCGKPGDTHIFNVSPQLEHRVTPTKGQYPRVAVAGWFTSDRQVKSSLFGQQN